MRSRSAGRGTRGSVPPVVLDVLRRPGRPLEPEVRADAEQRLGHSFEGVRVHDDPTAAESARAVGARAYAVGSHVVFDDGLFTPRTDEGRALLTHELAHVVQQRGTQALALQRQAAEEQPDARRRRLRAADGARLAAERVREALARGLLWSFETPSGDGKVNVKGAWTQTYEEREGFLHQLVVDLYGLATELDGTTITPDRLEPKFEDRGAEIEIGAGGAWQDTQVLYVHYKLDRETDPSRVPILSYVYISEPLSTPQVPGVRQPSAFQTSILINVPDPERP